MLLFARLGAGSSLLDATPGYLGIGFGYGLAVPTISATAMSRAPTERSGVGAGVLNTARQAGASVGLAVLGSVSLAAVTRAWDARIPSLPPGSRAAAPGFVQQVAGGEVDAVGRRLGVRRCGLATESFVPGLRVALLVAGLLMLAAAALSYFLLRPAGSPVALRRWMRVQAVAEPVTPGGGGEP